MWPMPSRRNRRSALAWSLACGVVLLLVGAELASAAASVATGSGNPEAPAFVTRPSAGTPLDIALDHLHRERQSLGLAPGDLDDVIVSDVAVDDDSGTTHIYLRQRSAGIEVAEGLINVSVAQDGSIITLGNRFVANLASAIRPSGSLRRAEQGVLAGATAVGLAPKRALKRQRATGGASRETVFEGAGISERPIPVKLVYVRDANRALRLAWNATILEPGGAHWWDVSTDASTGELLAKADHVHHATPSYNVLPLPIEAPSFGARSVVPSPGDPLASPFGWHDTDGVDGPEDTRTVGNNVHAGTDLNGNRLPDADSEPDGGPALGFDFPLDLDLVLDPPQGREPATYWPASVTNLFYTANVLHDVLYRHGFDEDAGSLQANDYGRGGQGGDALRALAQNSATFKNAFFAAAPDGSVSIMYMTIFWSGKATLRVTSPTPVDYELSPLARRSPTIAGVAGTVELVDDGVEPTADACQSLVGDTAGNIALIRSRPDIGLGSCHLSNVVARAEGGRGRRRAARQRTGRSRPLRRHDPGRAHDDGPGRCAAALAAHFRGPVQIHSRPRQ